VVQVFLVFQAFQHERLVEAILKTDLLSEFLRQLRTAINVQIGAGVESRVTFERSGSSLPPYDGSISNVSTPSLLNWPRAELRYLR